MTIESAAPAGKSEEKAQATHGSPTPAHAHAAVRTSESSPAKASQPVTETVAKPKPSATLNSPFTSPAELHGRESELGREEASREENHREEEQPPSEESQSVNEAASSGKAVSRRENGLSREDGLSTDQSDSPSTDDSSSSTDAAFPPPGSSSQEILAWWGQRTLKTSRTFAAQREERTHRELLERLRQSLALQNKDLQTKALQSKAPQTTPVQSKTLQPKASPAQVSLTQSPQGQTSLSEATLAPAEPALAACLYLAIHCAQCESVRQGRPDYPESSTVRCPRCGSESSFTVLGAGVTRKPLPFYEVKRTDPQSEEGRPRIPWDPLGPLARTRRKNGEE
ncbi:MAG TPA: hypothetical protein VFK06_11200 [Candidatus Angelobacter sp.]|nr:hypothetical protein [Candidatus Angelobacter sp.]